MTTNQKNFQEISKRILQPSFFLQTKKIEHKEIVSFWNQMSDKINAYSYICDLIKQIASFEKDKKVTGTVKSMTISNLLCTLFSVSTFREFDKKNELNSFKEKECVNLQRANANSMICPHTIPIVENFFLIYSESLENQEPAFMHNLIGQICSFPDLTKQNMDSFNQESQLLNHIGNYYRQLEKYSHSIYDDNSSHYSMLLLQENQILDTGEFSFTYEYFLKIMRQKKRIVPRYVFDTIVRYFKVLPQIAKEFPDEAEKSILCLMHFTKQIITFFGIRDNESIRTILCSVQIFRRWPYPAGNMAQELVSILFKEKKLNGNAFRFKVREEIPQIDIEQTDQFHPQNPFSQNRQRMEEPSPHQAIYMPPQYQNFGMRDNYRSEGNSLYKAFIIADKDQSDVNYICNLSKFLVSENRIQTIPALRTSLVANMLSLSYNTHPDNDIPGIVSKKKKSDIFKIYCQLLRIFDKWDKLDDLVDIQLLQKDQFGKIINQIIPLPNDELNSDESIHNIIAENSSTFIPEYPYCELDQIQKSSKQQRSNINKMNTPQALGNNEDINTIVYYPLLTETDQRRQNEPDGFLVQFCSTYFDMDLLIDNPQYSEPHRFIVMGGDAELHGLVQILGEFFDSNDNKIMNQLDIRVFIVPTKKNTLAHYLATKDVWYQRYLYLPFKEDYIIPKFEKGDEGQDKGYDPYQFDQDTKNTLLSQELRLQILHSYIREANRALNVRVYKIQCYFKNNTQRAIYFCQYLEIGEPVKAELIYVDYLGNKWKEEVYEENFNSVKINNVYKEFFEGNTPFPNSHWLEFTCITQDNSKLFDNNLRNKHLFRKNSNDPQSGEDQVQAAFHALFTSVPVEQISISIKNEDSKMAQSTFQILVDGKIFNDLKKIDVEPVTLKNKIDPRKDNPHVFLSVPIMTFLPLKL